MAEEKKKSKQPKKKSNRSWHKKEIHVVRGSGTSFWTKSRKLAFPKYFRDSWQELKKVTWPSRKEGIKLTIGVIIFTLVFTAFIALADYGFGILFENVILGD